MISSARRFALSSDQIDFGAIDLSGGSGVNAFSVHARIKFGASALATSGNWLSQQGIVSGNGHGYMLGVQSTHGSRNVFWLLDSGTGAYDGTGSTGDALTADASFHSLVVTWNVNASAVYLDGTALAVSNSGFHIGGLGHLDLNAANLTFGSGGAAGGADAIYEMTDVGYWSSVLSFPDVTALAGGSPSCTVALSSLLGFSDPADTAKLYRVGSSPVTGALTGTTVTTGPTLSSPYAILTTPSATSVNVAGTLTIATAFGPYGTPGGTVTLTPVAVAGTISPSSGVVGTTFTYTAGFTAGAGSVTFANDGSLTAPVVSITVTSLPAVIRSAQVMKSGQSITLQFERASDHTLSNLTALPTTPTIEVNGTPATLAPTVWLDPALGTGSYPYALLQLAQPTVTTIVVTDKDTGFVTVGGDWHIGTGEYYAYNLDQTQHFTLSAGNSASWTFTGLAAGATYKVCLNWTCNPVHNSDHVAATVHDGGTVGTATLGSVTVNQKLGPQGLSTAGAAWLILGQFTISGTSLTVRINNPDNDWMWAGPCLVRKVVTEVSISPGDTVTLSAPPNWGATAAGGLNPHVNLAVTNHTGHPFAGDFDASPKRMPIGYNIEPMGFNHPYPFANFMKATQYGWNSGVYDSGANLIGIPGGPSAAIFMQIAANGVDKRGLASCPGLAGSGRWKLRYSIPGGSNPAGNFLAIVVPGGTDSTTVTVAVAEHTAGDGKREVEYDVVCNPNVQTPLLSVYTTDVPGTDIEIYGPSLANHNQAIIPDPDHPWNPEFLNALIDENVTTLRGLDLCAMGNDNQGIAFSDLTQPGDNRRYFNEPVWYNLPNIASIAAVDVTAADADEAIAWYSYASTLKLTFATPHGATTGQQISLNGMDVTHPAYGPSGALAGRTIRIAPFGVNEGKAWVVVKDATTLLVTSYNAFGPAIIMDPPFSIPASWAPGTVSTPPGGQTWTARCFRKYGMPVQMLIDLCNRIPNCTPWVNIPILFTNAAVAELVDVVLADLEVGRKVRFELSNETWNNSFNQCYVCLFQAFHETARYNAGIPGALPASYSGPYWYGWKAAQVFEVVRARAAAAGRSADVICVVGVQQGNPAATTASMLDGWNYAGTGGAPDELCGATYQDNVQFGAPLANAFAAMTDGQWMDVIEVSTVLAVALGSDQITYAHYNFLVSRGFTILDGDGRYVSGTRFTNYEGGPAYIVYNGFGTALNIVETAHRLYHHPRTRDIALSTFQRMQDEDTFCFNRFFYQGTSFYNNFAAMWTTHPGYSLETGLGDGTDGKWDNRTNCEDWRAVSVYGGAVRTWNMLAAAPGGTITGTLAGVANRATVSLGITNDPPAGDTITGTLATAAQPGTVAFGVTNAIPAGATITGTVAAAANIATVSFGATNTAPSLLPATAYTITGPSSGQPGVTSSAFTVLPNGTGSETITITPSGGGLSLPIVLTFTLAVPQTFTITPPVLGTVTLTGTNNAGLIDPPPRTYSVAMLPPGLTVVPDLIAASQWASLTFTDPDARWTTVPPVFHASNRIFFHQQMIFSDTAVTVAVYVGAIDGTVTVTEMTTGDAATLTVGNPVLFSAVFGSNHSGLTPRYTVYDTTWTAVPGLTGTMIELSGTGLYHVLLDIPDKFVGTAVADTPSGVSAASLKIDLRQSPVPVSVSVPIS